MKLSLKSTILGIFLLAFTISGFAQSVVDVARQERERQRNASSKVVVTGRGTTSTVTSSSPPNTATQAPSSAAKPIETTDNQGRNEKYWRDSFQSARDELARAEARAQILDLQVKELNTQLFRQSDMYNREYRILPAITATQKELDDARNGVERARKKIADLQEELRRSAGPAGWAR
jgi:chromosome segregation ATPase